MKRTNEMRTGNIPQTRPQPRPVALAVHRTLPPVVRRQVELPPVPLDTKPEFPVKSFKRSMFAAVRKVWKVARTILKGN